jgi:hypothetical protein
LEPIADVKSIQEGTFFLTEYAKVLPNFRACPEIPLLNDALVREDPRFRPTAFEISEYDL